MFWKSPGRKAAVLSHKPLEVLLRVSFLLVKILQSGPILFKHQPSQFDVCKNN